MSETPEEVPDTKTKEEEIEDNLAKVDASTRSLEKGVLGLLERLQTASQFQAGLEKAQHTLKGQAGQFVTQGKVNRLVKWAILTMAVVLVLFGYLLIRVNNNSSKINDTSCGLYQMFDRQIQGSGPDAADDNEDGTVTPEEQAEYDIIVAFVKDSLVRLDCE